MPADPTPAPPPEWALDAAHEYFRDQWEPLGIPTGVAVNVAPLARLLASVREGAILQAAKAVDDAWWAEVNPEYDNPIHTILSLLHTPPVPPQEGV